MQTRRKAWHSAAEEPVLVWVKATLRSQLSSFNATRTPVPGIISEKHACEAVLWFSANLRHCLHRFQPRGPSSCSFFSRFCVIGSALPYFSEQHVV